MGIITRNGVQGQIYWALVRLGYLVILIGLIRAWERQCRVRAVGHGAGKAGVKRQRHPHSPRDCPACCGTHLDSEGQGKAQVRAWAEQKSKRGRPKTVETEGYSCNNPACAYHNITDSTVHALVGYGKHRGADTIPDLKCQACQTKVSSRWNTPMYDLKTPASRVAEVLTASSEGVDVAAASRIFKHDERTIQRWLTRMATHSHRLHQHFLRDLICAHLQLDELVTKVRGVKERVWVWVALDAHTKIIPVIHLGSRTAEDAQRFVHEVWQRRECQGFCGNRSELNTVVKELIETLN